MNSNGDSGHGRTGGRLRNAVRVGAQALFLTVVSLAGSVLLFVLSVVSLVLVPLGIGIVTTPWVLAAVRGFADRRRLWAAQWGGVRIPSSYRPVPEGANPWKRCLHLLGDPAVRRDLLWLPVDMTAGFFIALLSAALLVYPLEGLALAAGLWRAFTDGTSIGWWYGFVPIEGQLSALGAGALGTVLLIGGVYASPVLLRAHFLLVRSVLSSGQGELAERVRVLTATRRDAVDTSAAELRRIERDLHDGAQARLVAMGMDLGTIEALVEKDPAKARELIAQARRSSAEALTELRDLVRGIHPPVLAERGLADAVRALALRMPLPVEFDVTLTGRLGAPLESAAYFAVSEVLTNAVKHSGAGRVWIDLHHTAEPGGVLRIAVIDDGCGGAVVGAGTGLSGVARRLGTFDGVLAVDSPVGGPTMVTMEIPCELF
ncbi:sensor histidine kinase [Streptomyces beigongshangae]|uniref:sensor histidine kinase n=1 Tax=Streptomyces beigongshangae TaxID=2841597 RepID=UPI001C86607D|nr:sensor domain-containing protein [Streptomyces sp. REN17]